MLALRGLHAKSPTHPAYIHHGMRAALVPQQLAYHGPLIVS